MNEIKSFQDLRAETFAALDKAINEYHLKNYKDGWIEKAMEWLNKIISCQGNEAAMNELLSNSESNWQASVSVVQLREFLYVLKSLSSLGNVDHGLLRKKLNEVISMPFLVIDEDFNSSRGRNTLFELRLACKFANAGYWVNLSEDHPDVLVKCNGREYAIECKRVFSSNSFLSNISVAYNQLLDNSLTIENGKKLGIIAISITRIFNEGGNLKLSLDNVEKASLAVDKRLDDFFKYQESRIVTAVSKGHLYYKVKAILLDYSDVAELDKPYWIHKQVLYKLPGRSGAKLIDEDTKPLREYIDIF